MKTNTLLKIGWLVVLIGGIGIYSWYQYELLRLPHVSLFEYDEVLFAPGPLFFSTAWLFLTYFVSSRSLHYWIFRR